MERGKQRKTKIAIILVATVIAIVITLVATLKNKTNIKREVLGIEEIKTYKEVEETEEEIKSSKYLISELYKYIGRIAPETSIEEFKKGINKEANAIHIYKRKRRNNKWKHRNRNESKNRQNRKRI